jgi:choline dehydrogenase-like flavoprotein
MVDQRCAFPRGKALGGGSVLNYMIYIRGNKHDYNKWGQTCPGWSYKDVLPFFKRSEDAQLQGNENSAYHGKGGPLRVTYPPYRTEYAKAFVKSFQQLGYKNHDYNGESQIGISFVQSTTKHGRRLSAAKAFLDPIAARPNLHITLNTRATKVLIDPKTKLAYGIEYVKNKKRYRVMARKEVILSAGGFHSPQLLMLSGIGPKDHLKEINVPLIEDLPVGETMYDHLYYPLVFRSNVSGLGSHSERIMNIPTLKQYMLGTGQLTVIGGVEAIGFIKTNVTDNHPEVPDVEAIFTSGSIASDQGSGIKTGMRLSDEIYNAVFKPIQDPSIDTFGTNLMLFHPKSKGYMRLKDNNPFHWPKYYTNYFTDPRDLETMVQGIKKTIEIVNTPAMKKYGAKVHDIPLPKCAHLAFGSDDYWRCALRQLSSSLHHQTGTCKMGPKSDPTTVVDHELRVHGVRNLRVADVGVIPVTVSGHTAAAGYMIGEKAAEIIKTYWKAI